MKDNFFENFIIKINEKIKIEHQMVFVSMFFSLCFFSLLTDLAGKERSIQFFVEFLQPNALYFLLLIPLSITFYLKIRNVLKWYYQRLIAGFINLVIITFANSCAILFFFNKSDIVNGWIEGTLGYWLFGTIITLLYFYQLVKMTKKVEKSMDDLLAK